jgi:hypothetical protein
MLYTYQFVYVNVTWCLSCDVIKFTDCLCKLLHGVLLEMFIKVLNLFEKMLHGVLVVMLSSSQIVCVNVTWCLVVMLYT